MDHNLLNKDLYENHEDAKKMFLQANKILDFDITDAMFNGVEDLKKTDITTSYLYSFMYYYFLSIM